MRRTKLSFESTLIELSSTAVSNAQNYSASNIARVQNKDIWREAFYSRTLEAPFAGTHFKRTVFQFARRKSQNISY